jgi:hypothetical protein
MRFYTVLIAGILSVAEAQTVCAPAAAAIPTCKCVNRAPLDPDF